MAEKTFLSDISTDGKIKASVLPNSIGTIMTYNSATREFSTRTNAQIIQDLELLTSSSLSNYITNNTNNILPNDAVWSITSNTRGGQFRFTSSGYPRVSWGDSEMIFTDEGTIELNNYGFRQEDNTGDNYLYYDTYFKNVNFQNPQGLRPFIVTSNTLVENLNADLLDGRHASDFALASNLGNYLPITGGTMIGRIDMMSTNGIGSWGSDTNNSNYLTWRRADASGALGYIGGDGGGVVGAGNGHNFCLRAAGQGADLKFYSDTGNILANEEIVATRPWVDVSYVSKLLNITIDGVTQNLLTDRVWDSSGKYISKNILSGRTISDANNAAGTDFYYLNSANKPSTAQDGVLQSFSFDNNQWYSQMFSDWRTNEWYIRTKNQGTWSLWKKILHEGNFSPSNFIKVDVSTNIINGSDTRSNTTWFDYNWAGLGKTGSVINFSGLGSGGQYNIELFGEYQDGNSFWLRNRDGDISIWKNPVQIFHTGNLNPGSFMQTSHPANSITQFDINQFRYYWGYADLRNLKPSDIPVNKIQFGFGSFGNNNTNPWSDWIHFGGFTNSTGGKQNLIAFNKEGMGIRQFQADSQSTNPYTNYVEYWHSGNLNTSIFVTTTGVTQTITSDKTFDSNVTMNGVLKANGLVSNGSQSYDEIWTTNGSSRDISTLGKVSVQFNIGVDGQSHLLELKPKHYLATVPVTGTGIENTKIVLPKEARNGQEVQITNYSDSAVYVAVEGNTSNASIINQGETLRTYFEIFANPGDIFEDKYTGGKWVHISTFTYKIL